jgi:hypothetical protein
MERRVLEQFAGEAEEKSYQLTEKEGQRDNETTRQQDQGPVVSSQWSRVEAKGEGQRPDNETTRRRDQGPVVSGLWSRVEAKGKERRAKSQEPRAKSQEPRAKSEELPLRTQDWRMRHRR